MAHELTCAAADRSKAARQMRERDPESVRIHLESIRRGLGRRCNIAAGWRPVYTAARFAPDFTVELLMKTGTTTGFSAEAVQFQNLVRLDRCAKLVF
jgi:hypothetical protein